MMVGALDGNALVDRHGRRVVFDAEPTAILWVGTTVAVTLGDGTVRWLADDGAETTSAVHAGAILSACRHPDGVSVVTGGDDGRVCHVAPDRRMIELGRFERKWVEHLVASPASGILAAAVGRDAVIWTTGASAPSHRYSAPSTVGGLALDGKGKRLAISHYGGATLVYAGNPDSGRIALACVGSHLACTLSPDGRYLITALQETGLHGWLLPDRRDMHMSGYAAKTRDFSWERRGKWLATGGDAQAIVWPFDGRTGPMGKAPRLLSERKGTVVSRVAFHPRDDLLAIAYSDGAVVLARLADERTMLVDDGRAFVTTLAWNDSGTRLGWGDEEGRIGILDMETRA